MEQNYKPVAIATAIAERDNGMLAAAFKDASPTDMAGAEDVLSTQSGRAPILEILRGQLDGPAVRDALLAHAPDKSTYYQLSAGFAIGAIAAVRDQPNLAIRAAQIGQSLVEHLPGNMAEAFHTRAIFEMHAVETLRPEATQAIADFLYPILAGACQRRGSFIGDGFFDESRDPKLTPAGQAAICNFAPAVERLAAQAPIQMLKKRFTQLIADAPSMSNPSLAASNIKSAWQTARAEQAKTQIAVQYADPSAQRSQGQQAWLQ